MSTSLIEALLNAGPAIVVGIVASYITHRLQFEKFTGKDEAREKHWDDWRRIISEDVEALKKASTYSDFQTINNRMERAEKDIEETTDYAHRLKHVHVDPYTRAVDVLNQRVTTLEARDR